MCGIAGFCNGFGDYKAQIQKMTDQITHRGPDSSGYWMAEDKTVVLGHRRLSILDCSETGAQPMVSHSGRYVIVFNGEIYNHLEIRNDLRKKNVSFIGNSDTETLIEAFESYGIDSALELIKGMYGLALFDAVTRSLYLIRDRVGEKPLYYGFVEGRFVFASDVSCIVALSDGKLEIDKGSVELFFRRGYIPAPYSIYKNIYKVRPGHYIRIDYPYMEYSDITYWSAYDASLKCHTNRFQGSIEEAEAELERLLLNALKGQMLSDVPLGAFLSAGIDSSTIVSLMQEVSDNPVRTFTIGVDSLGYNEAPIARQVADILGTNHTEEYVSVSDFQAVIPSICKMYSEPFADSSQIPTSIISKVARKSVTVALSGDGGDELFCGYGRYNGWIINEWNKQRRFPFPMQRFRGRLIQMAGRGQTAKVDRLMSEALSQLYAKLERTRTDYVKADIIHNDYYDDFGNSKMDFFTEQDTLMQMDFGEYLPDDILAKVDRAAMYHSLETRLPFLDKDVIEFVWSLPLSMKYSDGITKKVLRNILYKRVPKDLIERPKTGFSIPMEKWFSDGVLNEWADSLFDLDSLKVVENYLDINRCRSIWTRYMNENKWDECLWYIIVFLQWYNAYRRG